MKTIVIEATQWWKNGDHPFDDCGTFDIGEGPFQGEGKVVRYYRTPDLDGKVICKHCNQIMHNHGWIEDGHIVCPGDYIITGVDGEYYPCKPNMFNRKLMIKLAEFLSKHNLTLEGHEENGVFCFIVSNKTDDSHYVCFEADEVSIENFIEQYLEPSLDAIRTQND